MLGRVIQGVKEAVRVNMVLLLDLIGENVDRECMDVLEDVETSADAEVRLQGYNGATLVVEHVVSGIQGGSGVDVDWEINSVTGFTQAVLVRTAGTISAGYGIDDLKLLTLPVATEKTSVAEKA